MMRCAKFAEDGYACSCIRRIAMWCMLWPFAPGQVRACRWLRWQTAHAYISKPAATSMAHVQQMIPTMVLSIVQ